MQEFLASFAVDIDESGVTRLQTILKDNRALAESLSEAFAVVSSGSGRTSSAVVLSPLQQMAQRAGVRL